MFRCGLKTDNDLIQLLTVNKLLFLAGFHAFQNANNRLGLIGRATVYTNDVSFHTNVEFNPVLG